MKRKLLYCTIVLATAMYFSCDSGSVKVKGDNIDDYRNDENSQLVSRGEYLTMIGGCNDCHTPKVFSPAGMGLDSSRLMAGHPAEVPITPVNPDALRPGNWIQMGPHVSAFAGPWGMSFAANLTPDQETGIGAWTEEVFVKTLRTGKHLGEANGRDILPPMPWFNLIKMTDEDFRAVYAYLKSLPPVNNRVPAPIPPDQVPLKK